MALLALGPTAIWALPVCAAVGISPGQDPWVAASYCSATLAGMRPRSLTAMPSPFAHARMLPLRSRLDAVRRVAAGGTALDPDVVAQLLVRRNDDPMSRLTPREQQVLGLMAEGRSNGGIVELLKVSPSAVEKYVTNIFMKLDLPPTGTDHRRVLAVLKYLGT